MAERGINEEIGVYGRSDQLRGAAGGDGNAGGRGISEAVAPARRRAWVDWLNEAYRVGIRRAYSVVMLNSSSHYYRPHRDEHVMLRMKIRQYAESHVKYGYLRIHVLLRREGLAVNRKRVYRLYRLEGLNPQRTNRRRKIVCAPRIELSRESRSNESWAMDVVSDQLFDGRRFRSLALIDSYT